MSKNIPPLKVHNTDLEFEPENNTKPDRVSSELNKKDRQYSLGNDHNKTTHHQRNKNYPPFLGRKQTPHHVPIHDL